MTPRPAASPAFPSAPAVPPLHLAARYVVFAAIATVANIGTQDAAGRLYAGPYTLYAAMAAGTLAGLVVKYILDKRWIFAYRTRGLAHEGWKFIVYTAMGLVTTLIFWGTELAFDAAFGTRGMRYAGAVLGLAVGYWTKYRLDKRFVFI